MHPRKPPRSVFLYTFVTLLAACSTAPAPQGVDVQEAASGRDGRFAVIVHSAFREDLPPDVAKAFVRNLYLGSFSCWPSGDVARPLMQETGSPVAEAVRAQLLHFDAGELDRHWLRQRTSTGMAPPCLLATDDLIVEAVARDPRSCGVVTNDPIEDPRVRVLFFF